MSLKPVAVKIHLLTVKGYLMQPALTSGLNLLRCTEDDCCLHVEETKGSTSGTKSGFDVRLECRRSLSPEGPWTVEGRSSTHITYRAVFEEIESASKVVESIRDILTSGGKERADVMGA